jgi:hypothetical protein
LWCSWLLLWRRRVWWYPCWLRVLAHLHLIEPPRLLKDLMLVVVVVLLPPGVRLLWPVLRSRLWRNSLVLCCRRRKRWRLRRQRWWRWIICRRQRRLWQVQE